MRILIITQYFPPLNSIASHRPYSWAAAWSKSGHDVHVLTTAKYAFDGPADLDYDLSGFTVHTVPYLGTDTKRQATQVSTRRRAAQKWDRVKLLTRRLRLGAGMFGEFAWVAYRALLKKADELVRDNKFDFIISTSPPEVVHFVGHKVAHAYGMPWVADYRDLWFADMRINQFRASSWLTGRLKRPILKQAIAVTTVSQGLAQRLGKFLGRQAYICYNGFFRREGAAPGIRPWDDDRRHIVYTGRMFPGKRDPDRFFAGLAMAMQKDPRLSARLMVDIYGYDDPWIRQGIATHGVGECVTVHGLVSHADSLNAQAHADALFFLDWMDDKAEGILTGKLFEYLSSSRPILCIGSRYDTEAAQIITQARVGAAFCKPDEICDRLLAIAHAESDALPDPDHSYIQRFSRLGQAEDLLKHIHSKLEEKSKAAK